MILGSRLDLKSEEEADKSADEKTIGSCDGFKDSKGGEGERETVEAEGEGVGIGGVGVVEFDINGDLEM